MKIAEGNLRNPGKKLLLSHNFHIFFKSRSLNMLCLRMREQFVLDNDYKIIIYIDSNY